MNENMTKAELVDSGKKLARKNKILGFVLAVAVFAIGGLIAVKGNKEQAAATFAIGGEILTAVFEGENVVAVSATAPVTVTPVSVSTVGELISQTTF